MKTKIVNYYIVRKIINAVRNYKVYKTYYSVHNKIPETVKKSCVIYCADGHIKHGGLADRLYGILTTYALCKIKNIRFYIYYVYPYDLSLFLVPGSYDWRISEKEITYNSRYAVPKSVMGGCRKITKNAIKIRGVRQIHFYSNFKYLETINNIFKTDFTYKQLFDELFTFSQFFMKDFSFYQKKLPEKYTSLQIRIQNALNDFDDVGCITLGQTEQENLIHVCNQKIKSVYEKYHVLILLTSDSEKLLNRMKEMDKGFGRIVTIPGEIIHTDTVSDSSYELNKKTFIDFFLLAEGQPVCQIKDPYIYVSGFSIMGAHIRGKECVFI